MGLSTDDVLQRPSTASGWIDGSSYPLDWRGHTARTFEPFPDCDLSEPIFRLFERIAHRHGDRTALDDGAARLDYRTLRDRAAGLAAQVASTVEPGRLVGILLPTSAPFPMAMLACLAAGRPFVPIDLHYPREWIAQVIDDAGVAAVICLDANREAGALIPPGTAMIEIGPYCDGTAERPPAGNARLAPLGPDEPAMVLYTSGSTGRPKGIVNSQRNLLRRVEQYANAAHISAEDRFLPLSSDCTIAGIRERLTALLTGAALHLIDMQRSGASQVATVLHRARISVIYAVPALLRALTQLDGVTAPESLRVVRVGGDAVLWSDIGLLRRWLPPDCLIELGYSSTEAPIMQWFVPADFPAEGSRVPIGYPLAGNALAVLDDAGNPVAAGEIGELTVKSPYVALGHWIGGRCAAENFPADPIDTHCRILRTGDLVRLRPDGLLDLVGRNDRQVKIRGQRVEPAEVESALMSRPEVLDAAVLARRSEGRASLVAYVVTRPEAGAGILDGLRDHLRTTLPVALRPHRLYAVSALPRLPSAKLDMKRLLQLDEQNSAEERRARQARRSGNGDNVRSPRGGDGSTESVVAEMWARILKREEIGRNEDFFDLGGDSLAAIQLMHEIETRLGVDLPITVIYDAPTVATLSAAIARDAPHGYSPLVLIKPGAHGPPFFLVHGAGGNVMELFHVGRLIEHDGPIYAVQAKGLDGRDAPHRSIDDMAACYLAAIRGRQPHGPYCLAGYSYGGLVAFDIARRLKAQGQDVALLALLDTTSNRRVWPFDVWAADLMRRMVERFHELRRLPSGAWFAYLRKVWLSFVGHVAWRTGLGAHPPTAPVLPGLPPALAAVHDTFLEATGHYAPGYYDGTVTLLKAERFDGERCDPVAIWKSKARALDVRMVPGDHSTMIVGTDGMELARILTARLAEATGGTGRAATWIPS